LLCSGIVIEKQNKTISILFRISSSSKRFEEVYDDTRNIWLYQKYLYTREYYIRSPFFPPFSVGYDFYYLFRRLYFSLRKALHKTGDRNQPVFSMYSALSQ